jgi:hypothetical protein
MDFRQVLKLGLELRDIVALQIVHSEIHFQLSGFARQFLECHVACVHKLKDF